MTQESIELIFRGQSKKAELEPVCREVLKHFQLPQQKLVAIFDDEERPGFISSPCLGENFVDFSEQYANCAADLSLGHQIF
jgi:hypothetical protein